MILLKTKYKYMAMLSLLIVLLTGKITYAAEEFFWSDVVPTPTCYSNREGDTKEMGVVKDGKKVSQDIPSCEDAVWLMSL